MLDDPALEAMAEEAMGITAGVADAFGHRDQ